MLKKGNIYSSVPEGQTDTEYFETLHSANGLRIERIVGLKEFNEPGKWYDQEEDEWVILLQGNAELEIKNEDVLQLGQGDYVFLPAHKIHRISRTSGEPKCLWLAVFGKMQ